MYYDMGLKPQLINFFKRHGLSSQKDVDFSTGVVTSVGKDVDYEENDDGKEFYYIELDSYKNASKNGNRILLEIEEREKNRTGVKNLKVGYNKIFGYFIEISKVGLKTIDPTELGYHRKQTLSNCERFISEELKEVRRNDFKLIFNYPSQEDIKFTVQRELSDVNEQLNKKRDLLYKLIEDSGLTVEEATRLFKIED